VSNKRRILDVSKLTLRFRGLTAVNAVDLSVDEGQIFAVIGPNGAGKTSLFNAITGIYEPTEGTVSLEGQDLRRAPTRATYLRWALAGLGVGLLMFLWVCDVNQLWSAVVKANFTSRKEGFHAAEAFHDLGAFIAGKPRIERRTGRFYVVTSDGQAPFGSSKTRAEADKKRDAIKLIAKLPADGSTLADRDGKTVILASDGQTVLDEAPDRDSAMARLAAARAVDAASAAAVRRRILGFILGLLVGTAGAAAVFRQTRRTPSSVAQRGIARTFQNIRLFQDMTVMENVLVGMDRHLVSPHRFFSARRLSDLWPLGGLTLCWFLVASSLRFGWLGPGATGGLLVLLFAASIAYLVAIFRLGYFSQSGAEVEATGRAEASKLLEFVGLDKRAGDLAKNLPYGDQRRLEIARALATRPKLLLLDEPAAGMNPAETVSLMKLIQSIRDRGVTVLLIEHHMRVVMGISDRIAVLVYGSKIAEGTPDEIRANPKVVEAYLGSEELG
jgi:ABC-type branched-subunit amino acid transport system ATPase component